MKKVFSAIIFLLILITGLLSFFSANEKRETLHTFALDTVINITAQKKDAALVKEALSLCSHYENIFSRTNPESELYKVNSKEKTVLSSDLEKVLSFSLDFCRRTDGAFDITVAPLTKLWNIKERKVPPEEKEISEALRNVGYEKVTLSPFSLGKRELDLGAVAKGYIADCLTEFFKEKGVEEAIIDLGGNVALIGNFSVGIRDPFDSDKLFAKIRIKDKSAVTSGAYQRYFEYEGERYHHILDPRTGKCASSSLASVTVISPSSMHADALSTAIYVLGENALSLCAQFPDTDALLITDEGKVITTDGFGEKYGLQLLK